MKLAALLLLLVTITARAQFWPQVSITTPTNGSVVPAGPLTLRATATDVDGWIDRVVYYVDGGAAAIAGEPPYEAVIDATAGRHKLHAIAYDNVGYSAVSAPTYYQVGDNLSVNLLRGPYLQSCTTTSIVIRWRTDWPTNSIVRFGTSFPAFNSAVTNNGRTMEHLIRLTGLTPGTTYYYEIATSTEVLWIEPTQRFHTAPTNDRPVKIWVIGDSGTGDSNAEYVRDRFLQLFSPNDFDVWLMLGDNAYELGTDDEFQNAVFVMYQDILRALPVYPTLGNHDVEPQGGVAQLQIFSPPIDGEAGGVPSGTARYFSFDYANVHFVCLDSYTSSRAPTGAMLTWLRQDLAATTRDWIIAYWHAPPYGFASHNSDTEHQMVEMRQNALPILEAYGVDLVLSGHNHVYDRSMFINGHYGHSSTLTTNMIRDASLGRDPAPYRKPAGGLGADAGTVYAVCGNSGQGSPGPASQLHPVTATKTNGTGFMTLQVDGLRLEAKYVDAAGTIFDTFVIDKSAPATVRPRLEITRTLDGAELAWPTSLPAYSLVATPLLATNAPWQVITGNISGRRHVVTLGPSATNQFFRLRAP